MPKLTKIRLTGCKYDGMQKEHENSIFDLTREDAADHTLFTLFNGGGKGVMMQLIFQLMLPGTKWGKSNGNKVVGMFRDRRNNLQSFTFHVVLEWVLDTEPERRLITGIAVKSRIKNTEGEEEDQAGLSYFLYTHEYQGHSYFTVDKLPLYQRDSQEATDLSALEAFIDEHKQDFRKFSKSDASNKNGRYYNHLLSKGLYLSEWRNLKEINKSEGGVGDYFTGAGDNKSIFDKIILPAISENLRTYSPDEENNLVEMFKSNLSITKDLPVLKKREGDYKELLAKIDPLMKNADSGSRYLDRKDRLNHEGNAIYYTLKDEAGLIGQAVEKWKGEEKKALEEKGRLAYEKDNIAYNQKRMELKGEEEKVRALEDELREIHEKIEQKNQELLLYQVNRLLGEKKAKEQLMEDTLKEKQRLMEILEESGNREKAKALDGKIIREWNERKEHWKQEEDRYQGYMHHTEEQREGLKRKKKEYLKTVETMEKQINRFSLQEEDLSKVRKKLEESYDPLSLLYPERILEELENHYQASKDTSEKNAEKEALYQKEIEKLNRSMDRLEMEVAAKEKEMDKLQQEIHQQEAYEGKTLRQISKQLMESYDGSLLTHAWFKEKLEALKTLETDKKEKLEALQRRIWEKNMDRSLNKGDYFVPNRDILTIKEEMEKLGIHGETGNEYLMKTDEEERREILESDPGFIYAIVIGNQRDWEIIEKNIPKDLFLHNLVPIYVRSDMNQSGKQTFKTVTGKGERMIEREVFQGWKADMDREIAGLEQTEKNIKEDLTEIAKIRQDINIILEGNTARELQVEWENRKEDKKNFTEEKRLKGEGKAGKEGELEKTIHILKAETKKQEDLRHGIDQLRDYMERAEEVREEEVRITAVRRDLKGIEKNIENLEETLEEIRNFEENVREQYRKWEYQLQRILEEVKEVYVGAEYHHDDKESFRNEKPPDMKINSEELRILVKERKALEKSITENHSDIAVLENDLKHHRESYHKNLAELEKLSRDWKSFRDLAMTMGEIEVLIKSMEKAIGKLREEKSTRQSEKDRILGALNTLQRSLRDKEEQIRKDHQRAPTLLEDRELSGELDLVERNIRDNERYLKICGEELESSREKERKVETNLIKMKSIYPVDPTKAKAEEILKEKVQNNPDQMVDEWILKYHRNINAISKTEEEGERNREAFIREIRRDLVEDQLKEKIIDTLKGAKIGNFRNNRITFESMKQNFEKELLSLSRDKQKAEEAMSQWTKRASIHVIRMVEALKTMVGEMNYTNEQGYAFPLVKLKGTERLPQDEGEITVLLEDYFIKAIEKVLEKDEDITNLDEKVYKNLMGDVVLFSKALQGRYPTLLVYKMSERNEFRFARAREEYYTTWEAINKGEGDMPEGSGGQTLSVNTFVIMMIMSFKKKHTGNENPSTVLLLDNPFGKASAKHVLDPIFEIADKLNFQLICFAAPEIIKVEISERFPVFWELKLHKGKVLHGGRIM